MRKFALVAMMLAVSCGDPGVTKKTPDNDAANNESNNGSNQRHHRSDAGRRR